MSKKQEEEQMSQSIYDLWPCERHPDTSSALLNQIQIQRSSSARCLSIRKSVAMKLLLGWFFQDVHDQLSFRSWQSAGLSHNCLSFKAGRSMRVCWCVKQVSQLEWSCVPLATLSLHRATLSKFQSFASWPALLFFLSVLKQKRFKAFWGMVNSGPSRQWRRLLSSWGFSSAQPPLAQQHPVALAFTAARSALTLSHTNSGGQTGKWTIQRAAAVGRQRRPGAKQRSPLDDVREQLAELSSQGRAAKVV